MGHENVVCFVKTLDLPSFLTIENAFYSGLELLSWPIIQLCPLTLDRNINPFQTKELCMQPTWALLTK